MGWIRPLSLAEKLVVAVIGLGLVHHADHVLRADHYGFPFKPQVTLFTSPSGFTSSSRRCCGPGRTRGTGCGRWPSS